MYELPDPSIKALRDGLHNVRLTDSTASSAQYRARYRDEQIELAMEKSQAGQPAFLDESTIRLGYGDFEEDIKDFKRKGKKTVARLPQSTTRELRISKSSPPSSSGAESAWHQQEQAPQRRLKVPAASSMIRFQRLLGKIEIANTQSSCKRLLEQWEGDDEDLEAEFHFETALRALVGLDEIYEIAQSNYRKSAPNYCLDGPSMVKIQDGMDVLHLGAGHDSPGAWLLGAKHSLATFCSLSIHQSSLDLPSSSWGWPPNIDSGLWDSCPVIPHPDNTFDVVLIHPLFHVLPCTHWPVLIKEAVRVLKPGNCLAIHIMDPVPKRAGPLLESWTTQYLALGLARRFMVSRPNLLLPGWIREFADLSETVVEAIELPIHAPITPRNATIETHEASSPRNNHRKANQRNPLDTIDEIPETPGRDQVRSYASLVGKHLYRGMYEEFAPLEASPSLDDGPYSPTLRCWWWDDPEILDECRRFDSAFEMVMYMCRKDDA